MAEINGRPPCVSIIMATYNRSKVIGGAIESVLRQSFADWELIVVSDGSFDGTDEVMTQWHERDSRIRYLPIPHIGKIAGVSNAGLSAARGEFIAILDDDDWWADHRKLEKQVAFLRAHSEYVACGGGLIVMNAEAKETGRVLKPETDMAIRRAALSANPIANSSSMFRPVSGMKYDESLELADWDFWLTLGTKGKLYNFPEYFLNYRMWQEGISFSKQPALADAALRIVSKHRSEYPGFPKAFAGACLYWCYTRLPFFVRRNLNTVLSNAKKRIFSR